MHNFYVVLVGLANIFDGVVRVVSLGFIRNPPLSLIAAMAYARWSMREKALQTIRDQLKNGK